MVKSLEEGSEIRNEMKYVHLQMKVLGSVSFLYICFSVRVQSGIQCTFFVCLILQSCCSTEQQLLESWPLTKAGLRLQEFGVHLTDLTIDAAISTGTSFRASSLPSQRLKIRFKAYKTPRGLDLPSLLLNFFVFIFKIEKCDLGCVSFPPVENIN